MTGTDPDDAVQFLPERPVFYFCRVLPAYRFPVMERLNRRLGGQLVVCSGNPPNASSVHSLLHEETHGFKNIPLKNYWLKGETLHYQPFLRVFRQVGKPSVVLSEESPRSPSVPLLLSYARRQGAGTLLWGHFSSNNRPFNPRRYLLDQFRVWLAGRADGCVCYTEGIADMLQPYVPRERLFVARNTLDTDSLFALHGRLAREGKRAVRRRLSLPETAPVLLFIGRLIAEKGTDLLLDAYKAVRGSSDAALVVIGDGPEKRSMQARIEREQIPGVRFTGALTRWEDSAPYLYAADVMVQPGFLGLSINHAFAFGLPVVSQAGPPGVRFHGPEVDYIQQKKNGILATHGDLEALIDAVKHVIRHQATFSEEAYRYADRHLTIDRMVGGLVDAIRFAHNRAGGVVENDRSISVPR